MDGLIVIRSVTLSNHIAKTQLPEGVVVSYYRALGEGRRDNTVTPEGEQRAIESQRSSKELGIISEQISFQRIPKTILKYY
jgi:hypothetical protein